MFPEDRCLISLTPLTEKNRFQDEYTKAEIKKLAGAANHTMRLPFTRGDFVTEQPQRQKGMSISGYQPKLSLVIKEQQFQVVSSEALYILKPSPEDFPHLAENEHATMLVMKNLGFKIPDFGLTRFQKDSEGKEDKAFIIKRFDRDEDKNPIHQEQLDAAMAIAEKYGKIKDDDECYVSYEQVWEFLSGVLDNTLDLKKDFFRRIFVAYLLGNNDLHLRNFGILRPEVEKDSLAPIYDYVSVAPYEGYITDKMALPLLKLEEGDKEQTNGFKKHSHYTGYDFIQFGSAIGLKPKMSVKLMDDILKYKEAIIETYRNSFVPEDQCNAIEKWINAIAYYANDREEYIPS